VDRSRGAVARPGPAAPRDPAKAELWYRRGHQAETTGADVPVAMDAYERALSWDPDHAGAHVNLGRLHHEAGNLAAAEAHYRRALFREPDEPVYWFNLGVVLEDGAHDEEAAVAYERCLLLEPDFADAHFNLSGVLERQGDAQGALRHLSAYRRLSRSGAG
jgi:tetratricopeptide (TPR) repeat protein